ncbi:MAG: hypothetical protein ACMUJI_12275 [Erythrobacter sp.]|uniref:hypothetical protein n=1 Tax=Erythrobacter sp. TaxID=1042 RepID=UPI003A840B30
MIRKLIPIPLFATLALTGCGDEAASDGEAVATGGEAAGEVLGGTISDDMLPLEELTSTSPPAVRQSTTTTTTVTTGTDGGETSMETTVTTTSDPAAPAPAPPAPPATPEG